MEIARIKKQIACQLTRRQSPFLRELSVKNPYLQNLSVNATK